MKKVLATFALATIISMSGNLKADMDIIDDGFITRDTPTCVTPDYPDFVSMDSTSYCVCVKSPCPCKGYELAEYDESDSDIILAGGCSISATGSSANGGSVSVTVTCNLA